MVALISPTFSFSSTLTSFLPSRIACRASRTHVGQSESVSRGHPSGGFVFSYDLRSGFSDHFGVNDGFCRIWFRPLKTYQAPVAAMDSPFSTYLMGACMFASLLCANHRVETTCRIAISGNGPWQGLNGQICELSGQPGQEGRDGRGRAGGEAGRCSLLPFL